MSKVCLIVLCGLPASGKTTFVKQFIKFLNENVKQNWKPVHICYDELMPTEIDEKIFKNESENLTSVWKSYRLAILNCIEYFVEQLQKGSIKNIPTNQNSNFDKPLNVDKQCKIGENFDIIKTAFNDKVINNVKEVQHDTNTNWLLIIDDNMWLQSMRYQVCQLARKYRCSFSQIYFNISPDTCLRRNSLRDDANKISEDTILRMSERMEAPNLTNGWERFSTTWSDDDDRQRNYTKIVNLLTESFNHPCFDPNEVDLLFNQLENSLSIIHQSDVILRKAVTKWVALIKDKCSKDDLAEKVKSINFVKGDLLGKLRSGKLVLPPMGEVMGSIEGSELCEYLSRIFDEEMTKILGMD